MLSNKIYNPTKVELFIKERKVKISLALFTQSSSDKNITLNSTHYFVMKIPSKWDLQQIAFNHLSDADFTDVMNL